MDTLYPCSSCHTPSPIPVGGMCDQCMIDSIRGYRVRSLSGRCTSGFELGHGVLFHAIPFTWGKAFCGAEPGRHTPGWSDWGMSQEVTCPACLKKIKKLNQPMGGLQHE